MDGTLYSGARLFEQTVPFLEGLRRLGIGYTFLTNNTSRSKAFADEAGDAAGGGTANQVLHVFGAFHFAIRVFQAQGTAVTVSVVGVNHAGVGGSNAPGSLAGERHGLGGTAVIAVAQRHDLRAAGIAARRQNGGLVGFSAAVGEKRLGQLTFGGKRRNLLGERRLRLIGVDGGDVLQCIQLAMDFGVDLLIAVAHADGDDAAQKIQVLIAVGVPDVLILGARYDERLLEVMKNRRKQIFLVGENDFVFGHGSGLYQGCVHVGTAVAVDRKSTRL